MLDELTELLDLEVLQEPAYWIIVGLAVVGLFLGFGGAGLMSTDSTSIKWYIKLILFFSVFPIAYVLVKFMSK